MIITLFCIAVFMAGFVITRVNGPIGELVCYIGALGTIFFFIINFGILGGK